MYVCILQRVLQVFSFLHFAWHLHWTRPCHWFLIWELNTNPQLSILANVISCWIKKQCFCWGEGLNHRSCLLQLLDTKPRDVLLEETVPSRLRRKNCPAFPMLGYTGGLYHTDIYTFIHTHKLEKQSIISVVISVEVCLSNNSHPTKMVYIFGCSMSFPFTCCCEVFLFVFNYSLTCKENIQWEFSVLRLSKACLLTMLIPQSCFVYVDTAFCPWRSMLKSKDPV